MERLRLTSPFTSDRAYGGIFQKHTVDNHGRYSGVLGNNRPAGEGQR